nr:MAG TPA: hypothetical protein [Caudoviricetes sp.]
MISFSLSEEQAVSESTISIANVNKSFLLIIFSI